ncbi:MAG: trigger factor family protein, partial [Candidatus Sericytochromatia bacterium]
MKVTLEKKEKNNVHLEVEVEQERVKRAIDSAYKTVSQRVNIPGFRKGKAPKQLVEKTVGVDYIKSEALDKLLPEALTQAVEDQNLEIIEHPNVEVVKFELNE